MDVLARLASRLIFALLPGMIILGSLPVLAGEPSPSCQWTPEFAVPGLDGEVLTSVVFDDGDGPALWVGGHFRSAGVIPVNGLAKWDGITWTAIADGLADSERDWVRVQKLAVLDLGAGPQLYAGGKFSLPGFAGDVHIARWNGAGWSPLGVGPDGPVMSLAVFDDGSGKALYAGGNFRNAGGAAASNIAKWNGSSWSALGAGVGGLSSHGVMALEVFGEGRNAALYVGGSFSTAGSSSAANFAKWDGASWFPLTHDFQEIFVSSLAVFPYGSGKALFVGGSFRRHNGPFHGIAIWDGNDWRSDAAVSGNESTVYALTTGSRGGSPVLYAAGAAVLEWNSSTWSIVGEFFSVPMQTLTYFDGGAGAGLFGGGTFSEVGGRPASNIARFDGTEWTPLAIGVESLASPPGGIRSMKAFDGAIYAAGETPLNSGPRFFAKWQGAAWEEVDPDAVNTWLLKVLDDGTGPALHLEGRLEGGPYAPLKYDGSGWTALPALAEGSLSLAYFDSGAGPVLHAGSAGGLLSRLDGGVWSPIGSANGLVQALASFDDGNGEVLYAGGHFSEIGGLTTNLAKWDGVSWSSVGNWSDFRGDHYGYVWDLRVLDDGSGPALYALYNSYFDDLRPPNSVAKWDGTSWQALGPMDQYGPDATHSMVVFDDGGGPALYAGIRGHFQWGRPAGRGGRSMSHETVYKWSGTEWMPLTDGPFWGVSEIVVFDDGSGPALFAGGEFSSVDGITSRDFAKYSCSPAVDLTLALDGQPAVVQPGAVLTYSLLVRNLGPFDEPNAQLRNELPAGLACGFTSRAAGGAAGNTRSGSGTLSESLSLPVGSAVTYKVQCTVPPGSSTAIVHSAQISGNIEERHPVDNTVSTSTGVAPRLFLPGLTPTAQGFSVELPVSLATGGQDIAATAFSLDYDPACLDPDSDDDGVLDQVSLSVPGAFTPIVRFDPLDTDGEIDISIVDWSPPIAALGSGELLKIRFRATCPAATVAVDSPILFSAHPAPTFGSTGGQNIPGTSSGGVVRILPGPRGDCNGDHSLGAGDLVAVGLEIFDGDGEFWLDAPAPAFAGSPVGCDANASTLIRAADVVCANLLIFGDGCTGAEGLQPGAPRVEVSTLFDGAFNWISARLFPNGAAVGALAYSLDLDPARFAMNRIDADHDGVPDRLRLPAGNPGLATVTFDRNDADGELDVLIADLSGNAMPQGILVEIGVPAGAPLRRGAKVSTSPQPSFGGVTGGDLRGEVLDGILLFADGFESGTTAAWNPILP